MMSRHKKTWKLIKAMHSVLAEHHPMTVRQVFYQLVSGQVLKNTEYQYKRVSIHLREARQEGTIPWEWVEDRLRRPRTISMWEGLADFGETAWRSYRRDVWAEQPSYIECWLEKDALSGVFGRLLGPYGMTLNVGRGFESWSSLYKAAERLGTGEGIMILAFGDLDPSGVDIMRFLQDGLGFFDCRPEIVTCALIPEDVRRYNLPFDFTKLSDSRRDAYIAEYGDIVVELDALPVEALQERIKTEVEARMDLEALARVREVERGERHRLADRKSVV